MNKQGLNEFINRIRINIKDEVADEQYREIAITTHTLEETVNMIVDNHFDITFYEESVLMSYVNNDTFYQHLFVLTDIKYVTDEV